MSVLTAFLRQNNYYVEQQDLNENPHLFKDRIPKEEISSVLKTGNFRCKAGIFIDRPLDTVSLDRFNLIGFSIMGFSAFLFALLLSRRIKQNTNIPIVFGGPFISLFYTLYPEAFNFVDYMIVGDGRIPLLRLIDYLNKEITISEVPNLIYKDGGKLITTKVEHYPIEDIPMPDFNGLPFKLYKRLGIMNPILPYQITKGCTNRCSFCAPILIEPKVEFKTYKKVINELKQMKEKYNSNIFDFSPGSTIDNSYEYLDGLCDILIKERLDITWITFARVNKSDRSLFKKMYRAGCRSLFFGVESGSDRILKLMNKGFTSNQASKTLQIAYEAGINNSVFFIIGYPSETKQDINQTFEFIKNNRRYIYNCDIHGFAIYYGSPINLNYHNYGISNLIHTNLRFIFLFDELNGLKWAQRKKQDEDNYKILLNLYKKRILFKKYRRDFLSFVLYLWRFLLLRRKTLAKRNV